MFRKALIMACLGCVASWSVAMAQPDTSPGGRKPSTNPARRMQLPEGVKALRDVDYGGEGKRSQMLDLFVPKTDAADKPLPLIVWIHGGAWLGGSKENFPALRFLSSGYAVASLNYRLSPEAIFPAQIEDCKGAIRYLRANAAKNNIDPNRIAVWGSSAGGHLVALVGTSGDVKELEGKVGGNLEVSSRVQAVCDWFGPTDFMEIGKSPSNMKHNEPTSPESKLIGGAILENKDKCAKASPITYVNKDNPPFLIMHGDADPLVPLNQSELLNAALKKAGVDVTFEVIKGAGHGFRGPEIDKMVTDFFEKHLKGATAARSEK